MSGLYYTCVGLDSVVLTSERVYTHRDLSLNIYIYTYDKGFDYAFA